MPFATVCQRSLILPSRGFGLRDWVEDMARKKDATIKVSFEIDSVATMRDLVLGGLGWTILPYAVVQQAVQANQLFASQIVRPKVPRTLHFAYGLACGKQRNPSGARDHRSGYRRQYCVKQWPTAKVLVASPIKKPLKIGMEAIGGVFLTGYAQHSKRASTT